jgi:hypothetical protein
VLGGLAVHETCEDLLLAGREPFEGCQALLVFGALPAEFGQEFVPLGLADQRLHLRSFFDGCEQMVE